MSTAAVSNLGDGRRKVGGGADVDEMFRSTAEDGLALVLSHI